MIEPLAGLFGALARSLSDARLARGLATAAGAMLFVVSGEVIPETHRKGTERFASFRIVLGFIVMMLLDMTLC